MVSNKKFQKIEGGGGEQESPTNAVVKQMDGRLWLVSIGDSEQTSSQPLTDCEVETLSALVDEDNKRTWRVRLTRRSAAGATSDEVDATIDAGTLESHSELNAWAAEHGGFMWNLGKNDRHHVKQWILAHKGASKVVTAVKATGMLDEYGVVLGNGQAMDSTGELVAAKDDGSYEVYCKDGKFRTLTVLEPARHCYPFLVQGSPSPHMAQLHLREFAREWRANLGHNAGIIALGWYTASVLAHDELLRKEGEFPHLFTWGIKGSGKTTMIRDVHSIVGMRQWSEPQAPGLKPAMLRNHLAYTSGWPLYIDEVRDEENENQRGVVNMMRISYNGNAGQHTDPRGRLHNYPKRRGLSLLGEQLIGGDAERSRSVILNFSSKKMDKSRRTTVNGMLPDAQGAWMGLLAARNELAPEMHGWASEFRNIFAKKGLDSRQAWCWGVAAAGLRAVIGYSEKDEFFDSIIKEMAERAGHVQHEMEDGQRLNHVWDAMHKATKDGLSNEREFTWIRRFQPRECGGDTYAYAINTALIWRVASQQHSFARLIGRKSAMNAALAEDKYMIAPERMVERSVGTEKCFRAAVFFQETQSIPEWAKKIADRQEHRSEED